MTVLYPDVSHYNFPLELRGAPLVFAKATQGTSYVDSTYSGFKVQARQLGIPFGAYHWLDTTDAKAQAAHAFDYVGVGVPLMIDDEQPSINVGHTIDFVLEYRRLGGVVTLEYLPRWTWAASGKPDLRPLAAAGLHLVASDYSPGAAPYPAGAAWEPYGGVRPEILQYTDAGKFNGRSVDMNDFPGTLEELTTMITGGTMSGPADDVAPFVNARTEAIANMWPNLNPTRSGLGAQEVALVKFLVALDAKVDAIKAAVQAPAVASQQLVDQELGKALGAAQQAVTPPA